MYKKIFINLIFSLLFILSLSACGEKDTHSTEDNGISGKEQSKKSVLWNDSHVALDNNLEKAVIKNDMIYGYFMYNEGITVTALDIENGSVMREVNLEGASHAQSMTIDKDGNVYVLGKSDKGDVFWKIEGDDKITLLDDFELEDLDDRIINIPKGLFVDDDGYFYIWYETSVPLKVFQEDAEDDVYTKVDRIYVKDGNFDTLFYEQVPDSNGSQLLSFSFGKDGVATIIAKDAEGAYMLELHPDEENIPSQIRIDETNLTESCDNVAVVEGGFLFCEGSSLYKYMFDTQSSEKVLELSTYGIFSSDIIYMGTKGDAIEIIDNYGENGETEYSLIKEGESEKKVLSLGTIQSFDELEKMVTEFNRFSDDTRIEIVAYYDGQSSFDDAVERLKLDIVSGQAADILEVSMVDYDNFVEKGIFADLYPYMETDNECRKDMLMSDVLETYESDGHLYCVAPAFQVYSMWGSSELISGRYGVNLSELMQILKDSGKDINAIYGFSADEPVLTTLCAMGMDEFIDWDNRTCDFESESFKEVLKFAKEYAGDFSGESLYEGIQNGNILMSVGMISDVADYQLQAEIYGGDIEFIGYPTVEGTGTALSFRGSLLAINAKGENQDAAWKFIKYYLLNGYQEEGFPIVKEQFEKVMNQAMEDKYIVESGKEYPLAKEIYHDTETYIEIYKATQNDVDAVRQMIERADTRFAYHTEIQYIIDEEAEGYFSGQKELNETVELIQNRVALYLKE